MKEKYINFFKKNDKLLLNILFSILTYFGFLHYYNILFDTLNYNFLTVCAFFGILYFYNNINNNFDKRTKKYSKILAIILSIILIIGNRVYSVIWSSKINYIFDINSLFAAIIAIIGFSLFFERIIANLLIKQKKISLCDKKNQKLKIKYFIILIIVMVLCWIPYFLHFYPGILTNDSYRVLNNTNLNILNDTHCFGYTYFFGLIWKAAMAIFNDMTIATAIYTIVQMIILSLIYNFAIKYFYDRGLKKWICIVLYLLFALNPLHAHYSITIWRDILFSASILLVSICIYEFIKTSFKPNIKYIILYIISVFMMMFFRNNGIYVYLIMMLFLIIFTKNNKIFMRTMYIALFIVYFVIKGPVYNYFGIEKGRVTESYSIPLQQIARVIALDEKISPDDLKELEKFIDVSKIKKSYLPYISDPIKGLVKTEYLADNSLDFIKLWSKILIKYPSAYIESYLSQTLGYWYPNAQYWTVGDFRTSARFETENVYNTSYTPGFVDKLINYTDSRRVPFIMIVWSIGLQFILSLFSFIISMYNEKQNYLLTYLPVIGLLISILLATPVFCELRYVYAMFLCTPFFIIIAMFEEKRKKGVKK